MGWRNRLLYLLENLKKLLLPGMDTIREELIAIFLFFSFFFFFVSLSTTMRLKQTLEGLRVQNDLKLLSNK